MADKEKKDLRVPMLHEEVNTCDIYERFAEPLFAYILRQVENQQDAEDILLDVFLQASQEPALENLPEARQFAWLWKVARNKTIDYYRHRRLINWLPLLPDDEFIDKSLPPHELVERQDAYRQLALFLKQLSPVQQELIQLRYGYDLGFSEIGALLGKPDGSVRKMLSRTLHQLRLAYDRLEKEKKL